MTADSGNGGGVGFTERDKVFARALGIALAEVPPRPPAPGLPEGVDHPAVLMWRSRAAQWEAESRVWRDRFEAADRQARRLAAVSVGERQQLIDMAAACRRDRAEQKWRFLAIGATVGAGGAIVGVGLFLLLFAATAAG